MSAVNDHGGYIVIVRSMFDHPVLAGEYDRKSAWAWLIAHAAWCDHEVRSRGGVITLRRGEVLIGRQHLATVWGWTEKRVRTFMAELRQVGMLELGQRDGQYANVAKISNYERFQGVATGKGPAKRPTKGQRGASEGPHITKETKERIEGEGAREPSANTDKAILDQAFADYNRAAEAIGFARCSALTEQRTKSLTKRLADLGQGNVAKGAERFREALSAIPHDRFLAGKGKARAGDKPFRLDLERLLSTGSRMGDVLAKLVDLHDEHGPARIAVPNPIRRSSLDEQVRDAMAEHQAAEREHWSESADMDMEAPRDFH